MRDPNAIADRLDAEDGRLEVERCAVPLRLLDHGDARRTGRDPTAPGLEHDRAVEADTGPAVGRDRRRQELGGHVLVVERGNHLGDTRRVPDVDRPRRDDQTDTGLLLQIAPVGERLTAASDPERVRVAETEDARGPMAAPARVAVLELLEHGDTVTP